MDYKEIFNKGLQKEVLCKIDSFPGNNLQLN